MPSVRRRPQAYHAIMEDLSARAFRAYRALVYETEGFDQYFRESTVLEEIATLNIGSRPASRSQKQGIEDLRAIPWVFSWAQCRLMLPGWYGFGTAVKDWLAAHPADGLATLQAMHEDWPFFRTTLSNMDMVLSKSDIAIASRYAELVTDADLGQAHLRSRASRNGRPRSTRCSPSPASRPCSSATRCWPARSATAFPISIR